MLGREFLDLAREQLAGGQPRHHCGGMIHAYFAPRGDIQKAESALALLDAIDADPVRRAAAIAAIRP